ncbi:alpha/beta-hydrolase [Myriangium duriaei CBS 260.36]|uniref:Carboxylic ester hydrolase n=1 Tax=Myriangium duriaei CBS 260.36 TaxID=1168546 RepID=A0A9P4J9N5_9PEZI|nr:alpha/beta-hydrolase [Myriangium duriaei CBS 260.36]
MATPLDHATIGKIHGKAGDGVVHYLGVKYGVLSDRFASAELPKYAGEEIIDATKHAPAVLSPPDAVDMENKLIQLPDPHQFTERQVSDLEGLALNITVPNEATAASKYPVLAFVHGGGLMIGNSSWPIYDASRLVRRSVARRAPVVYVGINYRLAIPGFLSSSDLNATGYKANRGFRDQQLALKWLAKHIAGFGGDPANITLSGQSAGSASVTYHLQSEEPLFKRAILLSGSDLLMKASPPTDDAYDVACKALGLEGRPSDEKIKGLTTIAGLDMLGKIGRSAHTGPVVDGDLIKYTNTPDGLINGERKLPAIKWIESVMIGDCAFDGSIGILSLPPIPNGNAKRFINAANRVLTTEQAKTLVEIYSITLSTPDDQAHKNTLHFMNDIAFFAPTLAYATHFTSAGKPVHVYRFNAPNPWPGPNQGESSHILDVCYLFQNYNDALPTDAARKVAEGMADRVLAFTAGEEPFEVWRLDGGKACVFGESDIQVVSDTPEQTGRRKEFVRFADDVGFDKLDEVLVAMQKGS